MRQYGRLNAEDDEQSAHASARSSLQRRSASYDSMVCLLTFPRALALFWLQKQMRAWGPDQVQRY